MYTHSLDEERSTEGNKRSMEKRIPGAVSIALKYIKRKKIWRGENEGGKYIARNKIAKEIEYIHTYTEKKDEQEKIKIDNFYGVI